MNEEYKQLYDTATNVFTDYKKIEKIVENKFSLIGDYLVEKFPCITGYNVSVKSTHVNINIYTEFGENHRAELQEYFKREGKKELGFNAQYYGEKIQFR